MIEKATFQNRQDYLDYCAVNDIANHQSKYKVIRTNIVNGKVVDKFYPYGKEENDDHEDIYINIEPWLFPCLMVYYRERNDIEGLFVYPNDFR